MVDIAKKQRPWARYALIAVAIVGLCIAAYFGGRHQYRRWRSAQIARQAQAFFDKHDLNSAALAAQRGLRINKDSADCWKVLADTAEAFGRREAIYSRMRVVDLQPGSSEAILTAAETALHLGEPQTAADVLGKLSNDQRQGARYQALWGRAATDLGKPAMAVDALAEALKIEPKNEQYQLAHAAALLGRGWIEDRVGARETLERLKGNPDLRARALRALLKDSLAHGGTAEALGPARDLVAMPGATFLEKITLLDLLRRAGDPEFPAMLDSLKKVSRGNAPDMAQLAIWMDENDRFSEAVQWSNDFTAQEWSDPRVCAAIGLNILHTRDWVTLESFTQSGDWQNLEYLRHTLLARSLRERGKFVESRSRWMLAATAASKVPRAPEELLKLIANWGWDPECADLLRTLMKDPQQAGWASIELFHRLGKTKDTYGLWEVTSRLLELNPNNDAAANNFALYSLLLGKDPTHATEIAQKLYEKHPHEGKFASTYAYALHLLGQNAKGLAVMNSLSPELLQEPDIAAYYGILLADTPDREQAAFFLTRGATADLLPEERTLVKHAQAKLETDAAAGQPVPPGSPPSTPPAR
jgi:tetratricopeptide (TPR) repeat protein